MPVMILDRVKQVKLQDPEPNGVRSVFIETEGGDFKIKMLMSDDVKRIAIRRRRNDGRT